LCLALAARGLQGSSGTLAYATYLGGDGADIVHAMAIGRLEQCLSDRRTLSSNFPVTAGASRRSTPASREPLPGLLAAVAVAPDAFVVKLSPSGQIVYATYLGGAGADAGLGIAVDAAGNAYVVEAPPRRISP